MTFHRTSNQMQANIANTLNYKLNKIMSEPIMNLGQLEDTDEISEKKPNHHKSSLENLTLHQSFFTKE